MLIRNKFRTPYYFISNKRFYNFGCHFMLLFVILNTVTFCDSYILLWAGTSRPIIWNKNLRSLCVSAGWMYILTLGKPRPIRTSSRLDVVYGICQGLPSDILSIYIIIYFNGQNWLYIWYFILYVKKFGGFFNICCFFTHVTCYLYRSLCMIYL